jgi:DNA-binding XRE family transcriptional regulator
MLHPVLYYKQFDKSNEKEVKLLDNNIIIFDYSKLLGKIKENYGTQEHFASAIGIGRTALNQRLNNKVQFTPAQMRNIGKLLGISEKEYYSFFFTEKVR